VQNQDKIEIKNEDWGIIDVSVFSHYKKLISLNLSMNKISQINSPLDCPLL
jgi:hypothetical protein